MVTDIFGGSPSNLSMPACMMQNRVILYGANLPMLLKLAKARNLPLGDSIVYAKEAGRKYINSYEVPPGMSSPVTSVNGKTPS